MDCVFSLNSTSVVTIRNYTLCYTHHFSEATGSSSVLKTFWRHRNLYQVWTVMDFPEVGGGELQWLPVCHSAAGYYSLSRLTWLSTLSIISTWILLENLCRSNEKQLMELCWIYDFLPVWMHIANGAKLKIFLLKYVDKVIFYSGLREDFSLKFSFSNS